MRKIDMQNRKKQSVDDVFELFILSCKVKNLSPRTLINYKNNYHSFAKHMDSKQPIEDVDEDTINQVMLILLDNPNIRPTTINSYIRTIRVFLYWAMDREYLDRFQIKNIKVDTVYKECYTDEELALLLRKPNFKKCSFFEYKSWVLVCLLASTGQRIGAVHNLQKTDINFKEGTISFKRTKTRTSHVINIPNTLKPILKDYIAFLPRNCHCLFPNVFGEETSLGNTKDSVRRYNLSRGVSKTSSHLFRHTFAKNWIQSGYNQLELMRILGHSTLDMTNKYVNLYSNEVDINKCDMLSRYQKTSIKMR